MKIYIYKIRKILMKKILMTLGDNSMTMIYDMIVLEMTYKMRIELILTVGMTVFEVNDMTVLEMILTDYMTVTIIYESEVTLMKKVMSSMITPSLENSSKKYEMTNGIQMTHEVTHLVMTTNNVKVVMKQIKMVIQVPMKTYDLWTIRRHETSIVDVYMSA